MSTKKRVLFISQEVTPFIPKGKIAVNVKNLAQQTQEKGKEIRVFTPRYGVINKRRNELHEVLRLSGMNMVVNDVDHPLLIKVASIRGAKMQVYFIDNEEYFKRKATVADAKGKLFEDNEERSMFFIRGTLETVKKLGWIPDVIHCHGWMSSLTPLYLRSYFKEDPHFENTKVVTSIYNDDFEGEFGRDIEKKLNFDGIDSSLFPHLVEKSDFVNLSKTAIDLSDGVIINDEEINSDLASYIDSKDVETLNYVNGDEYYDQCYSFYDTVIEKDSILVE